MGVSEGVIECLKVPLPGKLNNTGLGCSRCQEIRPMHADTVLSHIVNGIQRLHQPCYVRVGIPRQDSGHRSVGLSVCPAQVEQFVVFQCITEDAGDHVCKQASHTIKEFGW